MELAAIFLPALGAMIAGFLGRIIGHRGAQIVTVLCMLGAIVCSVMLFRVYALDGHFRVIHLLDWIDSGGLKASWALRFDTLTAVMLIVVNGVSSLVHIYSVGYMSHDPHRARFMAYLSLFTFMMLMLVTADNLVQMFFGWEGVGLASYLLIGFWFTKESANRASMKAFIVNRVGDFGFMLGILAVFMIFRSVEFADILDLNKIREATSQHYIFLGHEWHGLTIAGLLLFVGAMGKSAQLGLHTWLPDAMEGPTPVSALIHAATMVTAGVFMLARLSPVYEYAPDALSVICILGGLTAFVAATIGLTQFDIKRVIAYSTMSQLGYMFFAIGVSAYGAAIFHLMTHAFFKALLFLGAGSVIHGMSDEQDLRKMGGIWNKIPVTYTMMWIGSLALAGMPFFAGYYSKDAILEAAFASDNPYGQIAYWLGIAAAVMTAFYSWRLLYLAFHGKPRADHHVMDHVHESPLIMTLPLGILAVGAIAAGKLGYDYFVGENRETFWGDSIFVMPAHDPLAHIHHLPEWVSMMPFIAGIAGITFATLFYLWKTSAPAKCARALGPIYQFVFRKWLFDELYDAVFVKPSQYLGRVFWKRGDGMIIDGCGPDGVASISRRLASAYSRLQTGYLYHYAFAMLVGVFGFVSFALILLINR